MLKYGLTASILVTQVREVSQSHERPSSELFDQKLSRSTVARHHISDTIRTTPARQQAEAGGLVRRNALFDMDNFLLELYVGPNVRPNYQPANIDRSALHFKARCRARSRRSNLRRYPGMRSRPVGTLPGRCQEHPTALSWLF